MKLLSLSEATIYGASIMTWIHKFIVSGRNDDHLIVSKEQHDRAQKTLENEFGDGYCDGDWEGGYCSWTVYYVDGQLVTDHREPDSDEYEISVGDVAADSNVGEYVVDYYYVAIEKNP